MIKYVVHFKDKETGLVEHCYFTSAFRAIRYFLKVRKHQDFVALDYIAE